jgi:uncharacterized protein (DUF2235 family)
LIVSLDGTSNEFGLYVRRSSCSYDATRTQIAQNTNVVEMHSRIRADDQDNQQKYYNSGLGTYVPYRTLSPWRHWKQWFTNVRELSVAWYTFDQLSVITLLINKLQEFRREGIEGLQMAF